MGRKNAIFFLLICCFHSDLFGQWTVYSTKTTDGLNCNSVLKTIVFPNEVYGFCTDNGFYKYSKEGSTWERYSSENGLGSDYIFDYLIKGSYICYGTSGGGLALTYNGNTYNYNAQNSNLGSNIVKSIAYEETGDYLWIATYGGGIGKRKLSSYANFTFTKFEEENGLPTNYFNKIFVKNGIVYAGSNSEGLLRFSNGVWEQFTLDSGLFGNQIFAINASQDGSIYVGGTGGLSRMVGDSIFDIPIIGNRVMQIDLIGDTIFLATDSGVEKIWNNGHIVLEVNNGGIQNSVLSFIMTDEFSFIGFLDGGGVVRRNEEWDDMDLNDNIGFSCSPIGTIKEDENGNIFALQSSKVFRFDGFLWKLLQLDNIGYIYSMDYDKQNRLLLLGTYKGVFIFRDDSLLKSFNSIAGISLMNEANKAFFDSQGRIWVYFNNTPLILSYLPNYQSNSWISYTPNLNNDMNGQVNGYALGVNGSVWFSSNGKGLFEFNGSSFINYNSNNSEIINNNINIGMQDNGTVLVSYKYSNNSDYFVNPYSYSMFKESTNSWQHKDILDGYSPCSNSFIQGISENRIFIGSSFCYSNFGDYRVFTVVDSDGIHPYGAEQLGLSSGDLGCYYSGYNRDIFSLLEDSNGQLWIGGNGYIIKGNSQSVGVHPASKPSSEGIFPNPVELGRPFYLNTDNIIEKYDLISLEGQKLALKSQIINTQSGSQLTFETTNLQPGIYFLVIYSEGRKTIQKLIISNK